MCSTLGNCLPNFHEECPPSIPPLTNSRLATCLDMFLGDFSLNSNANAMLIACSGGWQLTYSGCSYTNVFPSSRGNLEVLPLPLATCSWHRTTQFVAPSVMLRELFVETWNDPNLKKPTWLLSKRNFSDPLYHIAPQPVASAQANRR